MSWDEKLFGALHRRFKAWRAQPAAVDPAKAADMVEMTRSLALVANAVAGRPLELRLHPEPMALAGDLLWLPNTLDVLPTRDDNRNLALVATTFAAAALGRGLTAGLAPEDDLAWIPVAMALECDLTQDLPGWAERRQQLGALVLATRPPLVQLGPEAAVLEAVVQRALGRDAEAIAATLQPPQATLFRRILLGREGLGEILKARATTVRIPTVPLWGRVWPPHQSLDAAAHVPSAQLDSTTTERRSRVRRPPRRRQLDERDPQENPMTHSFEKVHTAEEHSGGTKRADGTDELADHHDALEELDLDEVVLSNERTSSVYQADLSLFGGVSKAETGPPADLAYDEWDSLRRRYLAAHCRLHVEHPGADPVAGTALALRVRREYPAALQGLRQELYRLQMALRPSPRQLDGPDIDLEAVVNRHAAVHAGREGGQRLYIGRRRRGHDVAVLVLLDASLSTDAWVGGRRVLDTARDAAALLLLALDDTVPDLALAGFCSYTHDDCRFIALKGFAEPTTTGLGRLAQLVPAGYTRMGAALRHARVALTATRAPRKLLVLISDGKPTDMDRYEGRHGVGDVRQALREAERAGVHTFVLALDPAAAAHLPAMFGPRAYAGLSSVGELTRVAAGLFGQLYGR